MKVSFQRFEVTKWNQNDLPKDYIKAVVNNLVGSRNSVVTNNLISIIEIEFTYNLTNNDFNVLEYFGKSVYWIEDDKIPNKNHETDRLVKKALKNFIVEFNSRKIGQQFRLHEIPPLKQEHIDSIATDIIQKLPLSMV